MNDIDTGFVPEWERDRKVVRRCACRGAVVVEDYPTAQAIHAAVVSHQGSTIHRQWSNRGGMEAELDAGRFKVPVITRMRKTA